MSSFESIPTEREHQTGGLWSQLSQRAPVSCLLICANLVLFIYMVAGDGSGFFLPSVKQLLAVGANHPVLLASGQWWRLLSYQFVHGGIIHLGFNMLALAYLGSRIEPSVGSWRFAVLYLVAGIGAGLTSAVWQQTVSVGASGSVFGLLAYGFVYERILMRHVQKTYGRKLRKGPYTGLVVANLILGLVVSSVESLESIMLPTSGDS